MESRRLGLLPDLGRSARPPIMEQTMRNVRRFYVPNAIVFLTLVTKNRRILFDSNHSHHVDMFFDKMRAVREFK
ncbi:MAG: hypothetical protein V3S14_13590, partial [Anaerolineae bacterium]